MQKPTRRGPVWQHTSVCRGVRRQEGQEFKVILHVVRHSSLTWATWDSSTLSQTKQNKSNKTQKTSRKVSLLQETQNHWRSPLSAHTLGSTYSLVSHFMCIFSSLGVLGLPRADLAWVQWGGFLPISPTEGQQQWPGWIAMPMRLEMHTHLKGMDTGSFLRAFLKW